MFTISVGIKFHDLLGSEAPLIVDATNKYCWFNGDVVARDRTST